MQDGDAMRALTPRLRIRSRRLRREQTEAEARLWSRLRSRQVAGAKFRRQLALSPFVVDFCCMEVGLIVEVDGGQHAERQEADASRSVQLAAKGFRVLRFWNDEVLRDTEGVLEQIAKAIEQCRSEGRCYGG
jgi:adenine-specific DNA-methyltransferase